MQYAAAAIASVGQAKRPGSPVAGQATVFIFPDLDTGNTTYKAVQRRAVMLVALPAEAKVSAEADQCTLSQRRTRLGGVSADLGGMPVAVRVNPGRGAVGYPGQLAHGCPPGRQGLARDPVVMTAQQQLGPMRPGRGRRHGHLYHRPGRAAAGPVGEAGRRFTRRNGVIERPHGRAAVSGRRVQGSRVHGTSLAGHGARPEETLFISCQAQGP